MANVEHKPPKLTNSNHTDPAILRYSEPQQYVTMLVRAYSTFLPVKNMLQRVWQTKAGAALQEKYKNLAGYRKIGLL